jgi:hypothetical protein
VTNAPRTTETVKRSPTSSNHFKGGRSIATFNGRKKSQASKSDPLMNASTQPRGNYQIAGIGRARDPSAIYYWNWATDFGGTVDMVTISF